MRKWGKESKKVYGELHPILQYYMNRVLQEVADISLICGHRGQREQNIAFEEGNSKVRWPHGKHNQLPSVAVGSTLSWSWRSDISADASLRWRVPTG
jgi:peptidoglycan L-alanyl-D-glutamate endopeptidase CwlK